MPPRPKQHRPLSRLRLFFLNGELTVERESDHADQEDGRNAEDPRTPVELAARIAIEERQEDEGEDDEPGDDRRRDQIRVGRDGGRR